MNVDLKNKNSLKLLNCHNVIFYDGPCSLCNSSVNWIIKHDKEKVFRYRDLVQFKNPFMYKNQIVDSFILYLNGKFYIKGNAIIKILEILKKKKLLFFLKLIPATFLDKGYDLIARNRKKLFPSLNRCNFP